MFSLLAQTLRRDSGADGPLSAIVNQIAAGIIRAISTVAVNQRWFSRLTSCGRKYRITNAVIGILLGLIYCSPVNAQTVQYNVLPAAIGSVKDTARIKPLQVGEKVPEVFWNAQHSFLIDNKAVRSSLSRFRGKLLLLDFWEPYCYACLLKFPALDSLHAQLEEQGNIVLVSSKQYRRGTAEYISQKLDEQRERQQLRLSMDKIIRDDSLKDYFPHTYIPHYILIAGDGTVLALGSVEIFDTITQIIKDEVHNTKNRRR
ncbi:thiol-disulfide oxidoreductase [compost metagenome]